MASGGNDQVIPGDNSGGEEGVLLSWKELSYTQPAKNSCYNASATLNKVTGYIKTKELLWGDV